MNSTDVTTRLPPHWVPEQLSFLGGRLVGEGVGWGDGERHDEGGIWVVVARSSKSEEGNK